MLLSRALDLGTKEVVSFVGGGGKTTALFRLAEELAAEGRQVVSTTTTHLLSAQTRLAPFHLEAQGHPDQTLEDLRRALESHSHVLLTGTAAGAGKTFGIEPELVQAIAALAEVDFVLVEADGARGLPFKAPAEHEPALSSATTLLVPVVGVDVIGKPVDEAHVHRPERMRALGSEAVDVVTPGLVAAVLGHREAGLKGRPKGARAIALLNRVEGESALKAAREIARLCLAGEGFEAVALGTVMDARQPVRERRARAAAVVLAAGGSTRMGGALKQLLPWGQTSLVENAVRVVSRTGVSQVVVVTGNRHTEVEQALAHTGVEVVYNAEWETGRASSVRAGIAALRPQTAGALFINADQPFLSAAVIERLIEHYFETGARIVAPLYKGEKGSPVLFDRHLFGELNALKGDTGGRRILDERWEEAAGVEIDDERAAVDLDTYSEYQSARAMAGIPHED